MIKWIKSLFCRKDYVGYRPSWVKDSLKKKK